MAAAADLMVHCATIRHCIEKLVTMLTFRVALFQMYAVFLAMRFVSTLTLHMRSTRLAEASTMRTLRHRTTLLVDVCEWPVYGE